MLKSYTEICPNCSLQNLSLDTVHSSHEYHICYSCILYTLSWGGHGLLLLSDETPEQNKWLYLEGRNSANPTLTGCGLTVQSVTIPQHNKSDAEVMWLKAVQSVTIPQHNKFDAEGVRLTPKERQYSWTQQSLPWMTSHTPLNPGIH